MADHGGEQLDNQACAPSAGQKSSPATRRRLSRWKRLCFSLLVTAGFFLLLEVILAATGVRPRLLEEDPYVGFSSRIPLFVEKMNREGERVRVTADNRLRLFNRQEFPAHKSAGTYRIFCLGGSTTYGHPYVDTTSFAGWLREFLPAADSSRNWEVINAGGISYASYRVALLMDELARYEPDLFIVYSGHNEFLESRTYRELLETPPLVRDLHSRLAGTRTFSLLERLLKDTGPATVEGHDARDRLPAEVDAILDRTIGPRSYQRDERWQQQVVAHYRYSLQRMSALAEAAGAGIIYVTPAANLRDFEPFKSEHRADLQLDDLNVWMGLIHQASEAFDAGEFDRALAALDSAAEIDDRYARLHFLRGRVLVRLERYAAAKQAFQRARDEDVCPLRALTIMEQMVPQVAGELEAPCVDFVGMMEQRAEHGIPGDAWFLDHVHPTIEGYRLLALELLQTMQGLGIVARDESWNQAQVDLVTRRVNGRLDATAHANALRNLAKTLRWAGKFEQAARLSLMAVQGLPGDGEAHVMAGDAWWRQGDLEAAEAEYLQALAVDANDLWALLQLGSVLLEQGDAPAALNYLQHAVRIADDREDAHFRLGNALYLLKDYDRAQAEYREALRLDPQLVDAHKNLAMIAIIRKDLAAAVEHFERALALDPQDAAARCELGWLFLTQGQTKLAGEELSLAALLDPRLTRVQLGLAQLAELEGRTVEAAEIRQRVRELEPDS